MNATFQMIMNDPILTLALCDTYRRLIQECETAVALLTEIVDRKDFDLQKITPDQKQAEIIKYKNRIKAYQAFLTAEEIYRTGSNNPIILTPLRDLMAETDSLGCKPYETGDAEEFFNALFAEVNLAHYPIGFTYRFERTYTPKSKGPVLPMRTEFRPEPVPTLQVEILKDLNGQQLVNAMFQPKINEDPTEGGIKEGDVEYRLVKEQRFFKEPPARLMIQLKRFIFDPKTLQPRKIVQDVEMPEQLMIEGTAYNLKTIVQHIPGHYVNYIHKPDGWYYISDSLVRKADDTSHGRKRGYLYFYERAD